MTGPLLTLADINKAARIRKLLTQSEDSGATTGERRAFRETAERLARRYRYGHRMQWNGKPVLASGDPS